MEPLFTWPGCKLSRIPSMTFPKFTEYREPFCGSAAVFFHLMPKKAWLNDLDPNVMNVYKVIGYEPTAKRLFEKLKTPNKLVTTDEAHVKARRAFEAFRPSMIPSVDHVMLFIAATRRSFRGNPYKPGLRTHGAKNPRSWISMNGLETAKKIPPAHKVLKHTLMSCEDFSPCIGSPGKDVFLFIDPPYMMDAEREKRNGFYSSTCGTDLHNRLLAMLTKTKHKFLLTIEDCPEYRLMYRWANVREVKGTYAPRTKNKEVTELFITNY